MARRRYRWTEVANMARAQPGRWRLHRDLVAVTADLARHAARRVPTLRPDERGTFKYRRANHGPDILGRQVFDLYVLWEPSDQGES